jgi:hypothetical protein
MYSCQLSYLVYIIATVATSGQEFKILGGSDGTTPEQQKVMADKFQQATPEETRPVAPPKESNETLLDRELKKAFSLKDDDSKVQASALDTCRNRMLSK